MKLLRIKLPDQLHARLKLQAVLDQVSMQEAAVQSLREWLDSDIRKGARNNLNRSVQTQEAR